MNKINVSLFSFFAVLSVVAAPMAAHADKHHNKKYVYHSAPRYVPPAGSHAGQMDTDGILSPGELRNPNIDYDRAQRSYERRGDYRVENRDNDAAAAAERRADAYYGNRDRYYYDRDRWHDDHTYHRNYDDDHWIW